MVGLTVGVPEGIAEGVTVGLTVGEFETTSHVSSVGNDAQQKILSFTAFIYSSLNQGKQHDHFCSNLRKITSAQEIQTSMSKSLSVPQKNFREFSGYFSKFSYV